MTSENDKDVMMINAAYDALLSLPRIACRLRQPLHPETEKKLSVENQARLLVVYYQTLSPRDPPEYETGARILLTGYGEIFPMRGGGVLRLGDTRGFPARRWMTDRIITMLYDHVTTLLHLCAKES